MKYPMFKVHIDIPSAMQNIEEVLRSGFINEGVQVQQFLNGISKWVSGYPVITNSCTSAITIALHMLDLEPGDEIITTSNSCIATNTPIMNTPAKLVWADINRQTGTLNVKDVERNITDRTKAVICMNWAGNPCDLIALNILCGKHNIKLIQDAAHSFGAQCQNKFVDAYADYTCYSFQAIKHINTGDGGMLVCRLDKDARRAKKLKWFGIDRDETKNTEGDWKGQAWGFDVEESGYKFNMNNISAAIGLSQLEYIASILQAHRRNATFYRSLNGNPDIELLKMPYAVNSSYWVFTFLTSLRVDRDAVIQALNADGIQAGTVHVPNHHYSCFKSSYKELPDTDYFYKRQISLPCGWWLEKDDIDYIIGRTDYHVSSKRS